MKTAPNSIILTTLENVNDAIKGDKNCLVGGQFSSPEKAYIELIQKLLDLAK